MLKQWELDRPKKLERMKRQYARRKASAEQGRENMPGKLREYRFPKITKGMIYRDMEFAKRVESLRNTHGDQIFHEIFSVTEPMTQQQLDHLIRA